MSWEIDLWGRVRYGRAAAAADAMSAAADFEFARQSLAAIVAKSWFLATEATLQAELARKTIADQEALVRLAESREQVGVGNNEDVYVARASVAVYQDALRQIEFARENAIRALEILMGHYPAAAATTETHAAGAAATRAGGPAVGAARAPPRRHRRRAPRRRRVQPHRRGQGGAAAGDRADDRRERHLERSRRPQGSRQSGLEPRR